MSNNALVTSLPSAQEFQTMKELGTMAVKSGLLPASINTPEKAVIIMLKGREIGIGPMEAFSKISVINGKPSMDAELMLSQIYRRIPNADVTFVRTNNSECVIEAARPGKKTTEFKFTIEDATRAQLMGKQTWKSFPAAMLRARCISAMARAIFPDALSGVSYTPEELGAEVDGDGNVVDVSPSASPQSPVATEAKVEPTERDVSNVPEVFLDVESDDHGEVECTFGKCIGTKIKDFGEVRLDSFVKKLREFAADKGSMPPSHELFIYHADAYLKQHEFDRDGER